MGRLGGVGVPWRRFSEVEFGVCTRLFIPGSGGSVVAEMGWVILQSVRLKLGY